MQIEYYHASKYGNGVKVAEEFKRQAAAAGVQVDVHHIKQVDPRHPEPADLYVISSPGRLGKPIKNMRRFLGELTLPTGTPCAVLTTEVTPRPDKKTGAMPTEEELAKHQRVRPIMHELVETAGLVELAEGVVHVTGIKGPLEDDWESMVDDFARQVLTIAQGSTT
jgi:menaquinone-dependent protoporphyrinogen IX oxidase